MFLEQKIQLTVRLEGLLTFQLRVHQLWWHGPSWLCTDESAWPSQVNSIEENNLPEARAKVTFTGAKSTSHLVEHHRSILLTHSTYKNYWIGNGRM